MFRDYFAWLGPRAGTPTSRPSWLRSPAATTILVARDGDEIVGCAALRSLEGGAGEMKRLYVRPDARGSGAGRALVEALIARAWKLGYRVMRLDTLPRMDAARALYFLPGFRPIERYNDNPIGGVFF